MSRLLSAIPLLRPRAPASPAATRHPFDLRHGVDTSGLIYAPDLPTGRAGDSHSEGYYATAPSLFRGAVETWLSTLAAGPAHEDHTFADYAFLDLGCGKGRVLMLASELPFRSVGGVELNPALARIARRNLRRFKRSGSQVCRDVSVECADALGLNLQHGLPQGPVLLFLFNSFGAEVLAPLMERLAASARGRSAPIDLIYIHPDHEQLVAATPGIELLRSAEIPFTPEDAQADVFGVSSDFVAVWRLASRPFPQ
ncbi:MAG TPA: class I SAM-dependent methyltransferase [Terracidiphilus sp.]|nr:class I SAM-dependent methyltransferase [Terracidiphilus sp.]